MATRSEGAIVALPAMSIRVDALRAALLWGVIEAPTPAALEEAGHRVGMLIEEALPARIIDSTRAADAALTRLCRSLYPSWGAWRKRRRAAGSAA
jgi:hypothetical protein